MPEVFLNKIVSPACGGNKSVIEAFRNTPRARFMDEAFSMNAYKDDALPIGYGQTISKPSTVAYMSNVLDINKSHKILEIGTGSGFQAAILARLAGEVYTVERIRELQTRAAQILRSMYLLNIRFKLDDGHFGWEQNAPYDRIIATAEAAELPEELLVQLKTGGKLLIPLCGRFSLYEKTEDGIVEQRLEKCEFVEFVRG